MNNTPNKGQPKRTPVGNSSARPGAPRPSKPANRPVPAGKGQTASGEVKKTAAKPTSKPVQTPSTTARPDDTPLRVSAPSIATAYINKRTITLAVILILIIMNVIAIASIKQRKIPEVMSPDEVKSTSYIDLEEMFAPPYDTAKVKSSDYRGGTLVLINGSYGFSDNHRGTDIKDSPLVQVTRYIKDKNFKARDNTVQLAEVTMDALNLMLADFVAQGGNKDVMVNEAYRSFDAQQSIYDSKVRQYGQNQKIAQLPGYSEHHTGLAIDFSIYPAGGVKARTFTPEADYLWIYNNCHKYGFVLRYPENKTDVTGISPESWHFRYVGVPHATYMYERGITLEEYLSELRIYTESIPLLVSADGVEYGVYYIDKDVLEYTEFNVPKNTEYSISGDNMGGFVVWYKTGVVTKGQDSTDMTDAEENPEA